jgi:uncharacterized protein YbaR (Trm112 family)
MLDPALLEMLVCPACKSPVDLREVEVGGQREQRLVCRSPDCGLRYPIREEIPVMLIDEADRP